MAFVLTVLSLYFASMAYCAVGPTANIFIENKSISPDGFNRSAVLAGGAQGEATFPGPLITGQKGDTFNLNVVNELTDTSMLLSTSIHWHGFFMKGTAWADGPVGVTQCPIAPGNSFKYQFTGIEQAGTYWYHSHYSTQYCDGLRGAMVVYDPNDPYKSQYDIDDESTVITLADWYHKPAPVLGRAAGPALSDATLINGLGRDSGHLDAPLAVISVMQSKRYRFRLVSISCDPNYTFSIDNHTLIIIEVDGNNVQPLSVDSIQIFAGQRYSFILQANQQISNYWVRALPNIGGPTGFTGGVNSAILRYVGTPATEPTTPQVASTRPMKEASLQLLTSPAAPGPAVSAANSNGTVIPLSFDIGLGPGGFTVNGASFDPPSVPVLLQIISGARTVKELFPSGSIYTVPANSFVEITIPGGSPGAPHPIHLHGHAFSVIQSAGSTTPNYNNPVRRDVVNSGASTSDSVIIRFATDNAGPWIMHCHIDWHMDRGLSIVIAEDTVDTGAQNPPDAWDQLCPIFDALPAQVFN